MRSFINNKLTLLVFFLSILLTGCSKNDDDSIKSTCQFTNYYYTAGTKEIIGNYINNYILVSFDSLATESQIRQKIAATKEFDQNYRYYYTTEKNIPLRLSQTKSCDEMADFMASLEKDPIVNYTSYCMTSSCGNVLGYQFMNSNFCIGSSSDQFNVKVIDQHNLTDLNRLAAETNTEIISQNSFMPTIFTLRTNKKSKGSAMQMANYFYETGKFISSQAAIFFIPVE